MTDERDEPPGDAGAAGQGPAIAATPRLRAASPPPAEPARPITVRLLRENKGPRVSDLGTDAGSGAIAYLPGDVVRALDASGRYVRARPLGILPGPGCRRQRDHLGALLFCALWVAAGVVTLLSLWRR